MEATVKLINEEVNNIEISNEQEQAWHCIRHHNR